MLTIEFWKLWKFSTAKIQSHTVRTYFINIMTKHETVGLILQIIVNKILYMYQAYVYKIFILQNWV